MSLILYFIQFKIKVHNIYKLVLYYELLNYALNTSCNFQYMSSV